MGKAQDAKQPRNADGTQRIDARGNQAGDEIEADEVEKGAPVRHHRASFRMASRVQKTLTLPLLRNGHLPLPLRGRGKSSALALFPSTALRSGRGRGLREAWEGEGASVIINAVTCLPRAAEEGLGDL